MSPAVSALITRWDDDVMVMVMMMISLSSTLLLLVTIAMAMTMTMTMTSHLVSPARVLVCDMADPNCDKDINNRLNLTVITVLCEQCTMGVVVGEVYMSPLTWFFSVVYKVYIMASGLVATNQGPTEQTTHFTFQSRVSVVKSAAIIFYFSFRFRDIHNLSKI